MTRRDPKLRPSYMEIRNHPFLTKKGSQQYPHLFHENRSELILFVNGCDVAPRLTSTIFRLLADTVCEDFKTLGHEQQGSHVYYRTHINAANQNT